MHIAGKAGFTQYLKKLNAKQAWSLIATSSNSCQGVGSKGFAGRETHYYRANIYHGLNAWQMLSKYIDEDLEMHHV